jgi:Ca2+-transporting ATPase
MDKTFTLLFPTFSLAVSVIPEGLVAVTTVTMALGVRRMAAAYVL